MKLAILRTDVNKAVEKKLGFLEQHLFRRKFGSEAQDISRTWAALWRVPLNFEENTEEKQEKNWKSRGGYRINSKWLNKKTDYNWVLKLVFI